MATYTSVDGYDHHYIDLSGPDGNAFVLMGYAKDLGRQIGMISGEIEKMLTEMKSGDYNDLVDTFDKYFGKVVELQNRTPRNPRRVAMEKKRPSTKGYL